ncbi:hypothetical protein ACN26Y_25080 [Micromonospora sp. WMMD558]|uniref:hypothetical protein n=1 Tax=unclassified Micromonospora TaxID=2617518 RepID=UPI0012B44BB2|nr:hypothetical protein [Micromonospora sp. WMMC415]QGN49224.1 hypothetical protein GKC29_21960 [Micromonospora sp. WMMC415]
MPGFADTPAGSNPYGVDGYKTIAYELGAHRCGDHDRQPASDASPGPWIRQTSERFGQPNSGFRHGQSCVGQGRESAMMATRA